MFTGVMFFAIQDKLNHTKIKPYKILMSYGFAEFDPNNPLNINELIKKADMKIYKMKEEHISKKNGSSS